MSTAPVVVCGRASVDDAVRLVKPRVEWWRRRIGDMVGGVAPAPAT